MKRRKLTIGIVLALLVLIGPPLWITYREFRQARLDHALIEAIKAGDSQKALQALADGANGEARDTGKPPTFQEVFRNLLEHFRHHRKVGDAEHIPALLLLYNKEAYEYINFDRRDTLVRALLDHGAQPNDRDHFGRSPLYYATICAQKDTALLLLERGADPNLADNDGETPLIEAHADDETKTLLEHGAHINAMDIFKRTALMYAAMGVDVDKVRILLEHGAKVETKESVGETALFYAEGMQRSTEAGTTTEEKQVALHARKTTALLRQYGAK